MFETILCVADAPWISVVTSDILRAGGFCSEIAPSARHALELIAEFPERYGMIITDHEMRPIAGPAFARLLRHRGYAGRVLVYSSTDPAVLRRIYHDIGVDAVVGKPAEPKYLVHLAGELLPHVVTR